MIVTLARKLSRLIGRNLGKDEEQIAVMEYGFIGLLQVLYILILTVIIGSIAGCLPEALVVFFSVGFLRRVIGGAHSEGLYSCLAISVLCIAGFSTLTRYVLVPMLSPAALIAVSVSIYLFAVFEIYRKAPVDSPNKPIRRPEKRRRLRREAFIVILVFTLFTVLSLSFRGISGEILPRLSTALAVSVLWQVCMLTKPGAVVIRSIDRLFGVGK